jgi:TolA-binding protein
MEDMVLIKKIFIFTVILTLHSCSWLDRKTNSLFGLDTERAGVPVKQQYVPKDQYDDLMQKYQELLGQKKPTMIDNDTIKNRNVSDTLIQDLDKMTESNNSSNNSSNNVSEGSAVQQTVDVFADQAPSEVVKPNTEVSPIAPAPKELEYQEAAAQVELYQQAMADMGRARLDIALKAFQSLERSPMLQIRVRSKFQIAEILFTQNEFDLASQVFEDIVKNYAFSGLVIDSLKRLVTCSEKLNLNDKAVKYQSMLSDIFGV